MKKLLPLLLILLFVWENLNAQVSSVTPITGLTGQTRNPSVEIRNFGLNDINTFDVTYDYNGTQVTENFNGLISGFCNSCAPN